MTQKNIRARIKDMDNKMSEEDTQPIVRVAGEKGIVWYPKLIKDINGKWTPKDKSFQKMMTRHTILEQPAAKTDRA